MEMVRMAGCDMEVSRFIFGTASIFNVRGRKQRLNLLNAAIDHGFTHFDTAPYYGFGIAERELGEVLRNHPRVTVTTKVGLYSAGGDDQTAPSVFARKVLGKAVPSISKPETDFSLARAKKSLGGSLRRLKRDQIDLYMLHEPTLDLVRTDEWHRWLEDLVKGGAVRSFGLALTADRLKPFLMSNNPLCEVIQMLDSLDNKEADLLRLYDREMQITYGYVSSAQRASVGLTVPDVLKASLSRNPKGAIIVSTGKVERLPQYLKLLETAR